MSDITEAEKDTCVDMFFSGPTTQALRELGVPDWLHIAPGKTRTVRAILAQGGYFNGFYTGGQEKTCAFAGYLMSSQELTCARCGKQVEPGAFIRKYQSEDWQFCCQSCDVELDEQDKARTKAYGAMVTERNRATTKRRAQRAAERRAVKTAAQVNAGQLEFEVKP